MSIKSPLPSPENVFKKKERKKKHKINKQKIQTKKLTQEKEYLTTCLYQVLKKKKLVVINK